MGVSRGEELDKLGHKNIIKQENMGHIPNFVFQPQVLPQKNLPKLLCTYDANP